MHQPMPAIEWTSPLLCRRVRTGLPDRPRAREHTLRGAQGRLRWRSDSSPDQSPWLRVRVALAGRGGIHAAGRAALAGRAHRDLLLQQARGAPLRQQERNRRAPHPSWWAPSHCLPTSGWLRRSQWSTPLCFRKSQFSRSTSSGSTTRSRTQVPDRVHHHPPDRAELGLHRVPSQSLCHLATCRSGLEHRLLRPHAGQALWRERRHVAVGDLGRPRFEYRRGHRLGSQSRARPAGRSVRIAGDTARRGGLVSAPARHQRVRESGVCLAARLAIRHSA